MVTTDNLSIALKKILEEQRSRDLKDLQHEEEAEEVEDETNTEGNRGDCIQDSPSCHYHLRPFNKQVFTNVIQVMFKVAFKMCVS